MSTLILYESESNSWEELVEEAIYGRCKYYASDIMDILDLEEKSFNEALTKSEKALRVLDFPLKYNFQNIFRATESGIIKDVKLSPLAVYFLTTHADPENAKVARLQLYISKRYRL